MAADNPIGSTGPGGSMEVVTLATNRLLHTVATSYYAVSDHRIADNLVVGFQKPDKAIVNPLVDGFRKPSSYSCTRVVRLNGRAIDGFCAPYSLSPSGSLEKPASPYDSINVNYFNSGSGVSKIGGLRFSQPPNVNELRTKVLNNIKDEVFDAAMVLGELQSTVNTVSTNLSRIGRSLVAFKKGKPRHFHYLLTGKTRDKRRPTQKFLKETSGLFLEWKYGITPSLIDLSGALKAMDMNEEHSLFNNPPLLVARADRTLRETVRGTVTIKEGTGHGKDVNVEVEHKAQYKARCDYRIKAEALRGLNRFGIGVGSIPTLLWDKTPFTFVLDMVIPVADIIKAWSALSGTEVVGYCETLYESHKVIADNGVVLLRHIPTSYNIEGTSYFNFVRTAYDKPPMPVPYVRNPIRTGNLATALALFTSLRKSA